MLKRIALLPLKVLLLPLIILTATASLLLNALAHLSCYIVGPFLLLLLGLGVFTVAQQMWLQTAILAGMAVTCVAALFCAAVVQGGVHSFEEMLLNIFHV